MPATLAALVGSLAPDDLATFVNALPRPAFALVRELADERVWAERWRHLPMPAPVVVTPAADPDALVTAEEAARELRVSLDTLYARVHRGELAPEPRVPGGRLKFRRANLRLTSLANGIAHRYAPGYDSARGTSPPQAARVDATRARIGPPRHGDDRRPLGARRAHRHAHGRGKPFAPGQAAWSGPRDPGPKGGGA